MPRSLGENIVRGRRAIALARDRGIDTTAWEECLATLERQALLAWASELAERDLTLPEPVTFVEAPLRPVTTQRVSWYATQYLRTIAYAELQQQIGGWGQWTPRWWQERQEEAIRALSGLQEALGHRGASKLWIGR